MARTLDTGTLDVAAKYFAVEFLKPDVVIEVAPDNIVVSEIIIGIIRR